MYYIFQDFGFTKDCSRW